MEKDELEATAGKCYVRAAGAMAVGNHGLAHDWRQAGKAIEFLMRNQKKKPGRPRLEGADAAL